MRYVLPNAKNRENRNAFDDNREGGAIWIPAEESPQMIALMAEKQRLEETNKTLQQKLSSQMMNYESLIQKIKSQFGSETAALQQQLTDV